MTYRLRGYKDSVQSHRWYYNAANATSSPRGITRISFVTQFQKTHGVRLVYEGNGPELLFESEAEATMFVLKWS